MPLNRLSWDEFPAKHLRHAVVCIGNFDGVHRGHIELLRQTVHLANQLHVPACVMTFDPPPAQFLQPDPDRLPLTTLEHRSELIHQQGIDDVIVMRTSPELLALGPEAFFEEILQASLQIAGNVEGFNFCFGRNRQGNTTLLAQMCAQANIPFQEVPPYQWNGEAVSSSRIRHAIMEGEFVQVHAMLGRHYSSDGIVVEGVQRGRTLGFPTANLEQVATLLPKAGVYAGKVIWQGKSYLAAIHLGPNVTFGESKRKLEVHLLDFQGDLYQQQLRVFWFEQIREVQKFASIDELKLQLNRDIQQVKEVGAPWI